MFDWFWRFLYSISEILFEIIDGLLGVANTLCGIDPIRVNNTDTDLMSYLLTNKSINYGFAGAVMVSIFLIMVFSIIGICKSVTEGKKSSVQVFTQAFKALLMFLFIPLVMVVVTVTLNDIVQVLYIATRNGNSSFGDFLFRSFLPSDFPDVASNVDYRSSSDVNRYLSNFGYDLSDYRFFFSWIVCIPLLITIARGLMLFVDRTLSIVILYIISPICISSSVVDDGALYKKWREKILGKYLTGYGMIIAVNIYVLVLSIITSGDVDFFPGVTGGGFLNFVLKMCFALGGGLFLGKIYGLIGSLFGGDNPQEAMGIGKELGGGFWATAKGAYGLGKMAFGKKKDKDGDGQKGGEKGGAAGSKSGEPSGNKNNNKVGNAGVGQKVAKALGGGGENNEKPKNEQGNGATPSFETETETERPSTSAAPGPSENQNDNKATKGSNPIVANAITGAATNDDDDDYDDLK